MVVSMVFYEPTNTSQLRYDVEELQFFWEAWSLEYSEWLQGFDVEIIMFFLTRFNFHQPWYEDYEFSS